MLSVLNISLHSFIISAVCGLGRPVSVTVLVHLAIQLVVHLEFSFSIRGRGVSYGDKQKSSSVQSSGLSTIISMVKSREKSSIIP